MDGRTKEQNFRKQVVWMSFILSILVILTHANNADLFLGTGSGSMTARVENLFGEKLAQIAVPGFFMVSAYLFFRNYDLAGTKEKWLRRIRSLFIPYLLWNAVYYLGYVIASRIPGLMKVVGRGVIPFSFSECFLAVFFNIYHPSFWFIYQLLLLILISPVLYLLLRRRWTAYLLMGLILFLVAVQKNIFDLNSDALFYYVLAAFLAGTQKNSTEKTEEPGRRPYAFLFLALSISCIFLSGILMNDLFTVCGRALGAISLWLFLQSLILPPVRPWMKNTFLVYAVHFALVRLINKSAARLLFGCQAAALILYFLMPVLIIGLVSLAAGCGRKHFPACYRLLSGNR